MPSGGGRHRTTTRRGRKLINVLIKAHCYWIREADVDGFRVDAVKHMGELASARFCSNVREYAYALGKRGFFRPHHTRFPHTRGRGSPGIVLLRGTVQGG